MVISFDSVFNKFLGKITEYKYAEIDENYIQECEYEWITSLLGSPRVRKLFSSVSVDDTERTVTYSIKNTINDDDYDKYFVTELLAIGFVIKWLTPYVNSVLNIQQVYSGKEENFYSQSAHLSELQALLHKNENEFMKIIRDYGTYFNSYVVGE